MVHMYRRQGLQFENTAEDASKAQWFVLLLHIKANFRLLSLFIMLHNVLFC